MKISKQTKKIKIKELFAKIGIWSMAALTVILLVWIVGFVLIKGFYYSTTEEEMFLQETTESLNINGLEYSVIVNKKVRADKLSFDQVLSLYSAPIRELNKWDDISEQDLNVFPALLVGDLNNDIKLESYFLSTSNKSEWPNYVTKYRNLDELYEFVENQNGAVAIIPTQAIRPESSAKSVNLLTLIEYLDGTVNKIGSYNDVINGEYEIIYQEVEKKGLNLSFHFLFDKPASGDSGGISFFIINTILLVIFSLLVAVPIGVCAALFFVEYAQGNKGVAILRMANETLAGVPSIIFGLFGRIFFVRILGMGIGFGSAFLTIALMVLPTITRTAEEALKTVDPALKEGSAALGATRIQSLFRVMIPSATPGILTGVILSIGRISGETAVLLYTLGSGFGLVTALGSSSRVLSTHLYLLFSEAVSFQRAFATATVLIFITFLTNMAAKLLVANRLKGGR